MSLGFPTALRPFPPRSNHQQSDSRHGNSKNPSRSHVCKCVWRRHWIFGPANGGGLPHPCCRAGWIPGGSKVVLLGVECWLARSSYMLHVVRSLAQKEVEILQNTPISVGTAWCYSHFGSGFARVDGEAKMKCEPVSWPDSQVYPLYSYQLLLRTSLTLVTHLVINNASAECWATFADIYLFIISITQFLQYVYESWPYFYTVKICIYFILMFHDSWHDVSNPMCIVSWLDFCTRKSSLQKAERAAERAVEVAGPLNAAVFPTQRGWNQKLMCTSGCYRLKTFIQLHCSQLQL